MSLFQALPLHLRYLHEPAKRGLVRPVSFRGVLRNKSAEYPLFASTATCRPSTIKFSPEHLSSTTLRPPVASCHCRCVAAAAVARLTKHSPPGIYKTSPSGPPTQHPLTAGAVTALLRALPQRAEGSLIVARYSLPLLARRSAALTRLQVPTSYPTGPNVTFHNVDFHIITLRSLGPCTLTFSIHTLSNS
jgi:hypothetical protein